MNLLRSTFCHDFGGTCFKPFKLPFDREQYGRKKITKYNEEHVVHMKDLINIDSLERKQIVKGRGRPS